MNVAESSDEAPGAVALPVTQPRKSQERGREGGAEVTESQESKVSWMPLRRMFKEGLIDGIKRYTQL